LPASYRQRFSNVQAAIGLEALKHLDAWTGQTVANAKAMTEALAGSGIQTPQVPCGMTHVYYQYAIYAERRDEIVKHAIRRGVDVETLHVDVCPRLPLFGTHHQPTPGAERTASALQLPVHAAMREADVRRVATVVREAVAMTRT
jgi:dTDP-4-amino-4,6-dideoxygalactose transaminase